MHNDSAKSFPRHPPFGTNNTLCFSIQQKVWLTKKLLMTNEPLFR